MNAPARAARQQEQEAPPVEIPQPILWNLANAANELRRARTARAQMDAVARDIDRLEKKLAELARDHRDVGLVETLHLTNARLSYQMADQAAEQGCYPRPVSFEGMEKEAASAPLELPAQAPNGDGLTVANGEAQEPRPFVPVEGVS